MSSITIRHNIEVAHRLSQTPGGCQNIHGHSMWVELTIYGEKDETGKLEGIDFADAKDAFRHYLDGDFDHHLLMHEADVWAVPFGIEKMDDKLPGLKTFPGDPTTENIAGWICEWATDQFNRPCKVVVHETAVNAASTDVVYDTRAI